VYDGKAVITRAKIVSPLLARPLFPVSADVRIQRNTLYANHFVAKCGPRGVIKVGRCRLTVTYTELKARMVSALETEM